MPDYSHLLLFIQDNLFNLAALAWFLICFRGYFSYTAKKSKNNPTLSFAMHRYRRQWIVQALKRENRIADTNIIANLERNVSFFASSTLLILAGLMTVLGSSDAVSIIVSDVPFSATSTKAESEMKILLLVCLFVYAFFKFTWSLRQYGFVAVMLGAADISNQTTTDNHQRDIDSISQMSSKAAGNFNNGLRTYYFCMAVLGWFVSPLIFMCLSTFIVVILYRREFKSATLRTLLIDLPNC